MKIHYIIFRITAIFFTANTVIVAQPSIDEVLAYTPERQFEYLTTNTPEMKDYINNGSEYSRLLVEIAASDDGATEMAMYLFNNYILLLSSNKYSPAYNELIHSNIMEKKLSQIILMPYKDLKVKRGAILAHANLYPPKEEVLQFFKNEIEGSTPDKRGVIESILRAFALYQSRQDYQIPEYVYEKLPGLVNHHSDSVQSQAIMLLTDKEGLEYLPELFAQLESNNHGASVSQTIVFNILSLDTSQITIDKLKLSGEKVNNTWVKELIDNSLRPKNIERLQKRKSIANK